VARGSGNTALAAARRGATTVGIDFVPALLERARLRAQAEGLEIELLQGDAESLPFDDESFDVVLSTFGAMFAPDQQRVADELLRVCRPGGRVGMANWTPSSGPGQTFRLAARFLPPPPGLLPPTNWALGPNVAQLFGDRVAWVKLIDYTLRTRAKSPDAWLDDFRTYFGPMARTFAALEPQQAKEYGTALKESLQLYNRATDGSLLLANDYVNVIVIKR
jgi:ubiquinone/menaquinone biosynthesis C-methylase UbiE